MSIEELYAHMMAEGYQALLSPPRPNWLGVLDREIEKVAGSVRVTDTERGEIVQTWLETTDEAEACAFYLAALSASYLHLTATRDEALIHTQQAVLDGAGIAWRRNDVPGFHGPGTIRHRLFVRGGDLKRAQSVLGMSGAPQ